MRSLHKRLIKIKRGEYKDNQDGEQAFTITTTAAVQEVCMVKGDRARKIAKSGDKGEKEKRQAASDRAKKNKNINCEGDSGWEEENAVSTLSVMRGRGSGSGSNIDSDKVVSKRSHAIAKSRRDEISSDGENGSKQNSGGQNLQVQGRG